MHWVNLENLRIEELFKLFKIANHFKNKTPSSSSFIQRISNSTRKIAHLFLEPSTRTLNSFVAAELNLNYYPHIINVDNSSLTKGETLLDTCFTLERLGFDAVVIRAHEENYYREIIPHLKIPLLNGGDGKANHPSQSLLDLYTIWESFAQFKNLRVLIVGDIKHSRVAQTNYDIMQRLGFLVKFVAPEKYQSSKYAYCDFDSNLAEADVVMLLRVQHERHSKTNSTESYNEKYGLNKARLLKMKKNAIILHPGPFNRNIEITNDVLKDDRCRIWTQVENGVWIRMAMLVTAFQEENAFN